MKILAVIPARGGSKRVTRKNLRLLAGRSLVERSVDAALGISAISDILVSTDDREIAQVAARAGALVPWLRPTILATDTATSSDVCLHALDWYESEKGQVDGLLLLQPTSPFRKRESILAGIAAFDSHDRLPVIGVSPAPSHPMWCFRVEDGRLHPFMGDEGLHMRSQDLPPAYSVNGAFYLISPATLRQHKTFYVGNLVPLLMNDPSECIDIDTEWDWRFAEAILSMGNRRLE